MAAAERGDAGDGSEVEGKTCMVRRRSLEGEMQPSAVTTGTDQAMHGYRVAEQVQWQGRKLQAGTAAIRLYAQGQELTQGCLTAAATAAAVSAPRPQPQGGIIPFARAARPPPPPLLGRCLGRRCWGRRRCQLQLMRSFPCRAALPARLPACGTAGSAALGCRRASPGGCACAADGRRAYKRQEVPARRPTQHGSPPVAAAGSRASQPRAHTQTHMRMHTHRHMHAHAPHYVVDAARAHAVVAGERAP